MNPQSRDGSFLLFKFLFSTAYVLGAMKTQIRENMCLSFFVRITSFNLNCFNIYYLLLSTGFRFALFLFFQIIESSQ